MLLANEGCGIGFGTAVIVSAVEVDLLNPFRYRSRNQSMLP